MDNKCTQPKHKLSLIIVAPLFLLAAAAIIFLLLFPGEKRADFKRLSSESYDTVFLSMYPADNFYEEDFAYWRGMDMVKTEYTLPSFSDLKSYLNVIARSGNTITTIYLGVLPEKLSARELGDLVQNYPGVQFEVILPNPSMDYWLSLSETECTDMLTAYKEFIQPLLSYDNLGLYFLGASEWLIANPANYDSDFLTTKDAALTIMLNSDRDHSYVLTEKNAANAIDQLSSLIEQYRTVPADYPNAADYSIFFLGDSVIGNYTGTTSIPGVVAGLTGARVFNLGYGGGSATEASDNNNSLPDIVNALLSKDTSYLSSDTEEEKYARLEEALRSCWDTPLQERLCFVINYGLNDYFGGFPISSDDPYDVYTYAGAVRTAVTALQQAYPDARIILITPNFTSYFQNGTEPCFDSTHILADYADCIIALSEELGTELLDNYRELPINAKNHPVYLADGCHPNETGRFLIGQRIARKLADAGN